MPSWPGQLSFCLASRSLPASSPQERAVLHQSKRTPARAVYEAKCASCHLPDMKGSNEAPPLAGGNFMNTWRNRKVSDLSNRIRNTMPISNPGSLGEQEVAEIVSYILQMNGVPAGAQAFTPTNSGTLGEITRGGTPAAAQPAAGQNSEAPSRTGASGWCACRSYRCRGSEKLCARQRRDAGPSRSARLADRARKLSGLESQRAHSDHPRKCEGPETGLGVGHERRLG